MLTPFDWLRRANTGAELIATLKTLEAEPDLLLHTGLGPPHSALRGPCRRCFVYPRAPRQPGEEAQTQADGTSSDQPDNHNISIPDVYCRFCRAVMARERQLRGGIRNIALLWGQLEHIPATFRERILADQQHIIATYFHDQQRFLLGFVKRQLLPWLQEIALYHGTEIRGNLQIFPTVGGDRERGMGEYLVRAAYEARRYPFNRLQVCFYAAPYHLLRPHLRDQVGLLRFDFSEFVALLEMAEVFRSMLSPQAQNMLFELLRLKDPKQESFYWGRFLGMLTPEGRDMLNAWRIRTWPRERVRLLYDLTGYVRYR